MNKQHPVFFVLFSILVLALSESKGTAQPKEMPAKRAALLVGIHEYPKITTLSKLEFCSDDAERISRRLNINPANSGGFDFVTVLTNNTAEKPTKKSIEDAVGKLVLQVNKNDVNYVTVMIVFIGHGKRLRVEEEIEKDGKKQKVIKDVNYLLPMDSTYVDGKTKGDNWISDEWLIEETRKMRVKDKLLIFNACRDAQAEFAPRAQGLPPNTIVVSSCGRSETALELRELKASLFSHYFIEAFDGGRKPNEVEKIFPANQKARDFQAIFRHVLDNTFRHAAEALPGHSQTPQQEGEGTGKIDLGDFGAVALVPAKGQIEITRDVFDLERSGSWIRAYIDPKYPIKKGTDLKKFVFYACWFDGITAEEVDFSGSDITGGRFPKANLRGSKFIYSNVTKADFTGANLSGADFTKAIGVETATFKDAITDDKTKGLEKVLPQK